MVKLIIFFVYLFCNVYPLTQIQRWAIGKTCISYTGVSGYLKLWNSGVHRRKFFINHRVLVFCLAHARLSIVNSIFKKLKAVPFVVRK